MAEITLEREFAVTSERLFEALSKRAELVRWWGHDGWTFTDENIDFSRPGPSPMAIDVKTQAVHPGHDHCVSRTWDESQGG